MKSIIKLIKLFSKKEQRNLIPLTIAVIIISCLEVGGIGLLGPFMAIVTKPETIHTNSLLSSLYDMLGLQEDRMFLIALGVGIFIYMLLATVFKMFVFWAIYRFIGNRRYTISYRLFRQYLYQPYSYFLDHNTSELSKNLLGEVDEVVNGVLRPAMDAFTKCILAGAILIFMFISNPLVAAFSIGIFGVLYLVIYAVVRPRLARYGKTMRKANLLRYKLSAEAFGAIKDVKILGKEGSFSKTYASAAQHYSATQSAKQIISTLPGQMMYPFATGFAIAMIIIMLTLFGSLVNILPLLAVYAFAIQRLIPEIKDIFQGASQTKYYSYTVDALYKDMTGLGQIPPPEEFDHQAPQTRLPFARDVEIRNLRFAYPTSLAPVLKDLNLSIVKNTTIGFVGSTGCGKTTLVDIIMCLLDPSAGEILVDGQPITSVGSWQRNFGYVPQQIYLSDQSVASNIAFGVPPELQDREAIERAARVANLHDFVVSELPRRYDTMVGERGIRLSGGQRQRIGIARALYHDPDFLVMDEATSALDSVTEDAVMDAIHNLMHTKTIILIAHRISTVKECDEICLMERGQITARGRYDDLLRDNAKFRAMAKVSGHE